MPDSNSTTTTQAPERLILSAVPVFYTVDLSALTDAELLAYGAELRRRLDAALRADAPALESVVLYE